MPLSVHIAALEDIPIIRELTYKIWPQSYSEILSPLQIDYMLDQMYSEAALTRQMEKQKHSFIIITENKMPVGFASYGGIDAAGWKIHKLYVLPTQQGKGLGRFIIDYIARQALLNGSRRLQLNVNRSNRAVDFYKKIGFRIMYEENIDIGSGYFMNDYVMEKEL